MKTLHFISLNNCFVSIHVNVRFTHGYRDFIVESDYAICIQIPALFKPQSLKNVCFTLHMLRNRQVVHITGFKPTRKHLQLSTDNKKLICCCKTLAFSDGTSFGRKKNTLLVGSRWGLR